MSTLLMRLAGPMQSWGTISRFDERDTQLEPSKSGVLGLVCAALGRDRSEPVDDLANLRMGVRVDCEGVPMQDYQTIGGDKDLKKYRKKIVINANGKFNTDPIESPRHYLSDAVFLVGLEGGCDLLAYIHTALKTPVWPLFLGRKSFVPSQPVYLPKGLVEQTLKEALSQWPLLSKRVPGAPMRGLLEDDSEGSTRLDQPVAPFAARRFGPRLVKPVLFTAGGEHASHTPAA
jgi:CRISPR system Cascade subunit CasD